MEGRLWLGTLPYVLTLPYFGVDLGLGPRIRDKSL